MATLKEEATLYEAPQTKNIADLEKVSIDIQVKEAMGTKKDGNTFIYKYFEQDGEEYRIPGSVLGAIKLFLEKVPKMKYVSVMKSGEGMATKYQVLPLES